MDAVVSVSDLTWHLKATLEDTFPSVHVRGEISNWRRAASGRKWWKALKSVRNPDASRGTRVASIDSGA